MSMCDITSEVLHDKRCQHDPYELGKWVGLWSNSMRGSRKFCQRGSNSDNVFFFILFLS